MAATKSGVVLQDGEQLIVELEAELWATTSNFFLNMGLTIMKVIMKILGTSMKGFVVVTNKRIIEVNTKKVCFVFTMSREIKCIMPHCLLNVGYAREGTLACFCPVYCLVYGGHSMMPRRVRLKGFDEDQAAKLAGEVFNAIGK